MKNCEFSVLTIFRLQDWCTRCCEMVRALSFLKWIKITSLVRVTLTQQLEMLVTSKKVLQVPFIVPHNWGYQKYLNIYFVLDLVLDFQSREVRLNFAVTKSSNNESTSEFSKVCCFLTLSEKWFNYHAKDSTTFIRYSRLKESENNKHNFVKLLKF